MRSIRKGVEMTDKLSCSQILLTKLTESGEGGDTTAIVCRLLRNMGGNIGVKDLERMLTHYSVMFPSLPRERDKTI